MKIKFVFVLIILNFNFSFSQDELDKSNLNSFLEDYLLEYDDYNGYPEFKSIEDSNIQSKINSRVRNIIVDQIKADTFNIKLGKHLVKSLYANFSVLNNEKDATDFFKEKKYEPILNNIEYKLSFNSGSILTLIVLFNYDAIISSYQENKAFSNTYYEVFYFDVKTGQEYSSNDVFNNHLKSELNNLLVRKLEEKIKTLSNANEEYVYTDFLFPSQYEYEDYEELDSIKPNNEKISNFAIYDYGFVFPKSFSMEYFVPIWSLASSKLTTKNISIRLTINEIGKFLNTDGPFRELAKKQKQNEETILRNIKNPPIHFLFNWEFDDIFIPYRDSTDNLKKTTIYRQINDRNKLRDSLIYQEIFRLKNGLIKYIKFYDIIGNYTEYKFEYDSNDNLSKISTQDASWHYKYNDVNNLIYINNDDDEQFETFYKYYHNFLITETYSNNKFFISNKEITLFNNTNKPIKNFIGDLSFNEVNYLYNKDNNLVKEIATYQNSDKVWFEENYTYDDENRILFHTYNINRKTSYTYDNFGRITERTITGGSINSIHIEYNNNRPIKIKTNQKSSGHTYFYSFSYEYW